MEWQYLEEQWVLLPERPKAVVQFLGGAFIGTTPQIAYDALQGILAERGYVAIATPYLTTPDHWGIAKDVFVKSHRLVDRLKLNHLPCYGVGHSLGCKLHLLVSCLEQESGRLRQGNVAIAYSNASFREQLPWMPVEFDPSPAQMERTITQRYDIAENLLVKFERDRIDDLARLRRLLDEKFYRTVAYRQLPGDHGTSVSVRNPLELEALLELSPIAAGAPSRGLAEMLLGRRAIVATDTLVGDSIASVDRVVGMMYQSLTAEVELLQRTVGAWLDRQVAQQTIRANDSETTTDERSS